MSRLFVVMEIDLNPDNSGISSIKKRGLSIYSIFAYYYLELSD